MNIPKAIKILKETPLLVTHEEEPDFQKAIKLGIEAMEYIEYLRTIAAYRTFTQLPGETKD